MSGDHNMNQFTYGKAIPGANQAQGKFKSRVSEITIEMDGLHITTVSPLEADAYAEGDKHDEARIGDFHMSRFTADEWYKLSALIALAINEVTR